MDELKNFWLSASLLAKGGVIGAVALVILLPIFLFIWSNRSDYQPLFTEISERDMASVAAALDKQKTPYKLSPDGKSILVDKQSLYKTRMQLMSSGLPLQGGVGLELFNNNEFGTTEFAQRVNYQRALQGELARTIMGFDEVQSARVHVVLPETGLLRRKGTVAKASVWLTMRGNSVLTPEQVSGIQRLVSASSPGIEPSTVTVIDHKGVALSINNQYGDGFYAGNANLQLKKEVEDYFTNKVMGILDNALGVGKAAVVIDVTLDYGQVQTTREKVLPAGDKTAGVLVRQREKTTGSENIPTASNSINSAEAAVPVMIASPTSKSVENDYQTGKEIEQILMVPGSVKRLNVGVVLPEKLPQTTIDRLQKVIAMGVGLDTTRGDDIAFSASNSPINNTSPGIEVTKQEVFESAFLMPKEWFLTALGIVLVAVIALVFLLCKHKKNRASALDSLSESEREKVLKQIKKWLEEENGEFQ